ncbi:MAG: BMC domain-containing protein, partial [Ignavibacteria bacterium]|nr:BMC domain-containing protein [Ignavibacteria bacterium]
FLIKFFIGSTIVAIESLGMIELNSVSASLKVMQGIQKEELVNIIDKQILGDGIVTLFIKGDLGAIRRALSYGIDSLHSNNEFRCSHIIPLPHTALLSKFGLERK